MMQTLFDGLGCTGWAALGGLQASRRAGGVLDAQLPPGATQLGPAHGHMAGEQAARANACSGEPICNQCNQSPVVCLVDP